MPERPAEGLDELLGAVAEAAGGRARLDWLASATGDTVVRERLATLGRAAAADEVADAYQQSLPADRRRADGHFVTDPAVAAACCRWAIQPRPDDRLPRVLDPAVGSGVFPVAATRRLGALAPDSSPADRLGQVVGVDTDPVPLALAADRLLDAEDPGPDAQCRLYETDFFAVEPGPDRSGTVTDDGLVAGRFDAVVGNPPYVRQETTDVDRARAHLAAFGPDGQQPYLDGDDALSRRSDAYVYFLTHATRFLRDGGRLGVVVPNKWLSTRYGEPFQRFLFDHYRLAAVVGFGARVFDDAFVDAVLLLAQRCTNPERRRSTPVRFLRLDEQVSVARLLDLVDAEPHTDRSPRSIGLGVHAAPDCRRVTVRQGRLADRESATLAPYLDAPAPFIRLLSNPALVPLSDRCTVTRGVMTGANDFFFLDADGWGRDIDDRFLAPAIKSIRDVDGPLVTAADTDRYLLDVHEYVADVRSERETDACLDDAVRRALDRDGHDALADYVAWGERQGFHDRRSCASRRVWFDLGALSAPAVFVPKFFDRRVPVVANPDGLLASNAVDCLWVDAPDDGTDAAPLVDDRTLERATLGVLNATVTAGILECWGRSEGGGALQVMTYELESLPIPDPLAMAPETRRAVAAAADALLADEPGARDRLDRLVVEAIDADLDVAECRRLRTAMVERRTGTSDRATAPLCLESGQR